MSNPRLEVEQDIKAIYLLCNKITLPHIPIRNYKVLHVTDKMNFNAKDEEDHVTENLKLVGLRLISFITKIINRITETRSIPNSIKCGILHAIHNKGKVINKTANYRGITIISIIYKVLDCIQA